MTNGDKNPGTGELNRAERRTERVVTLEVKLDTLIQKVDELSEKIGDRIENHEARLIKLERVVWLETGVFLLIVIPSALTLIARLLGLLF